MTWKDILKEEEDIDKAWPFSTKKTIGNQAFKFVSKDTANQVEQKYNQLLPKGKNVANSFIFNIAMQGKNFGGVVEIKEVNIADAEQKALATQGQQQTRTIMPDEARRLGW